MTGPTSIRRAASRKRWTTLDNRLIEDARLGPMALAILVYLLSKPDDWIVMIADLERRFGCKAYKVRAGLANLSEAGYVKLEPARGGDGTFAGRRYVVIEDPSTAPAEVMVSPTSGKLRTSGKSERGETPNIGEISPILNTEFGLPTPPDGHLKDSGATEAPGASGGEPATRKPAPRKPRQPKEPAVPDRLIETIATDLTGRAQVEPGKRGLIYPIASDLRELVGSGDIAGIMAWISFKDALEAKKEWRFVRPHTARDYLGRWAANGGAAELADIRREYGQAVQS